MTLRIITADERLSASENKTSLAIFGPPGVGKTTLITSMPEEKAVCFDLEAGMKSVQDWRGPSIPIRSFEDFRDLVILIGGPDPGAASRQLLRATLSRPCAGALRRKRARSVPQGPLDHLRRLDQRSDAPGHGLCQAAAGGVLGSDRQTGCARCLRAARARGHPGAEAPSACPRQDRDLRGRAGKGDRRVRNIDLAAADGRHESGPRTARHRRPGHLDAAFRQGRRRGMDPRRGVHRAPPRMQIRQPVGAARERPLGPARHDGAARSRRAAGQDRRPRGPLPSLTPTDPRKGPNP